MNFRTPMRWPETWKDPAVLELLKGTAIDYLLLDKGPDFEAIRARAQQIGIEVGDPDRVPAGVEIVKGAWPGVQWSPGHGGGPTGAPWVDSNGWVIRLNRALHPEVTAWIDAPPPPKTFIVADSYLIAVADSAAHGGRWIISLDTPLAQGLATGNATSLTIWKRLTATAEFFAARKAWVDYVPVGVAGIVSDFAGDNEFFSHELLNLMARAGLHYRIVLKDRLSAGSFEGLRAISYTDATPPTADLRRQILAFVESGGLLIAAPQWGEVEGTEVAGAPVTGYKVRAHGKGRIAVAEQDPADPYAWAADAALLVSHRYDLVRFWNSGAASSFYTMSPDRKKALVHLLFFAERGPDSATVRIAGRYRAARASTVDNPKSSTLTVEAQADGVEVRLPQVSQYVALELDV